MVVATIYGAIGFLCALIYFLREVRNPSKKSSAIVALETVGLGMLWPGVFLGWLVEGLCDGIDKIRNRKILER